MSDRHSKAKNSFGFGIFPESEQPEPPNETITSEHSPTFQETDRQHRISNDSASRKPFQNSDFLTEQAKQYRQKTNSSGGRFSGKEGKEYDQLKDGKKKNYSNIKRSKGNYGISSSRLGPVGRKGEPLCLAELLAQERNQGLIEPDYDETYEKLKQHGGETYLSELEKMSLSDLIEEARRQSVENADENSSRQELLFQILKKRIKCNGLLFGEGTLEILPDQFGFLRSSDYHYLSSPDDIYISPSQIRRFGLRPGCTVSGQIRPPKENERYFALLRVEAINHEEPGQLAKRPFFEDLTPVYPNNRIVLSKEKNDLGMKIIDSLAPFGFGQRGLLISPPKAGKTVLLRKMASAALANNPDLYVFVLLIDERPEEATEMGRQLKSEHCEVICSLFDEPVSRHIHVAEMVLEKAKRMVECGRDVVIFLDSLTQLARAWNMDANSVAQLGSSMPETINLQFPKKYFGSARKADEGGSLTILATLFSETGNSFDESLVETFKGTGNWEVYLDKELAEKRIWPAINIHKSSAKQEDSLLSSEEFKRSSSLRRQIADMPLSDALNHLSDNLD